MRVLLLLLVLLSVAAPAASSAAERTIPYVLGLGAPLHMGVHCQPVPSIPLGGGRITARGEEHQLPGHRTEPTNAAGACVDGLEAGEWMVRVVDSLGQTPPFWWSLQRQDPHPETGMVGCGSGVARGALTLTLPEPCDELHVSPMAGSAAGTIRLARAS